MSSDSTERACGPSRTGHSVMGIGVIMVHLLVTFALIGIICYLLWLTRSPEILNDKDAADAIHGLKIGALVLVIPVVFWAPGIYGMWKHRFWGWWLTLITGLGMASVFVYSMIADGWNALDAEDAAVTAAFVILPLLLLLPQVRTYYRKPQHHSSAAIGTVRDITDTIS